MTFLLEILEIVIGPTFLIFLFSIKLVIFLTLLLKLWCDIFNIIVKTVVEKHTPFVTHKIKGKIEVWITNYFLKNQREELF